MNKERKNYLAAIRFRARRIYTESLESPFSYCGLCGKMLVWVRKLPDGDFIRMESRRTALIRLSDGLQSVLVGTVDHIVRIAEGGTNDISNLAGLCLDCHRDKDEATKDIRYCRICLNPVEETDFRRIHTDCQREERFLTYKLGERFQF